MSIIKNKKGVEALLQDSLTTKRALNVTFKNRLIDRLFSSINFQDKNYTFDKKGLRYSVRVEKITPSYVFVRGTKQYKGLSKFNKTSIKAIEV